MAWLICSSGGCCGCLGVLARDVVHLRSYHHHPFNYPVFLIYMCGKVEVAAQTVRIDCGVAVGDQSGLGAVCARHNWPTVR